VQTTTLQLPCITPLQPHQNQPVEHKNNLNNTRTTTNLHQIHQNATKCTNEFTPQANPSVDRLFPTSCNESHRFLSSISLEIEEIVIGEEKSFSSHSQERARTNWRGGR
jgi:hypothetical protein